MYFFKYRLAPVGYIICYDILSNVTDLCMFYYDPRSYFLSN